MPANNPQLRDKNFVPVAKGVDSTDTTLVLPILVSPTTGALLCET